MPPAPEAVQLLEAAQGADGGWPLPLAAGRSGSVAGTCEALGLAHDWGLLEVDSVRRGLGYLEAQQQADGTWRDAAVPGEPTPRWLVQGEEAGRLYLTAWASSLLAAYNRHNEPAAGKALDVLLKYQLEDGLFAGFPLPTAWYGLPILARVLGARSGPARSEAGAGWPRDDTRPRAHHQDCARLRYRPGRCPPGRRPSRNRPRR